MMNDAIKRRFSRASVRITGQVEGIARMVEEDRYCVDVLLQIEKDGQNERPRASL